MTRRRETRTRWTRAGSNPAGWFASASWFRVAAPRGEGVTVRRAPRRVPFPPRGDERVMVRARWDRARTTRSGSAAAARTSGSLPRGRTTRRRVRRLDGAWGRAGVEPSRGAIRHLRAKRRISSRPPRHRPARRKTREGPRARANRRGRRDCPTSSWSSASCGAKCGRGGRRHDETTTFLPGKRRFRRARIFAARVISQCRLNRHGWTSRSP